MSEAPTTNPARAPQWRDPLALLLLAVVCAALRFPSLQLVALNPDESEYEATAAYLVATGTSAFAIPSNLAMTLTLYKGIAAIFGPYCMLQVRMFVLVLCLSMTLLLYLLVRRETNWLGGLLSGLVFLYLNPWFEGLTANREWFAGLPLLLGACCYFAYLHSSAARRWWALAGAGAACGVALWFKMQTIYMVAVVPLLLVWSALTTRSARRYAARLAAYGGGLAAATVVHLGLFQLQGTLSGYVEGIVSVWRGYVIGNPAAQQAATWGGDASLLRHLYFALPARPLFLVAYVTAVAVLIGMVRKAFAGRATPERERIGGMWAYFAVYLVTALLAIKAGNRFFAHYYLFAIPPLAALAGMAAAWLWRSARGATWLRYLGFAFLGLWLVDRSQSLLQGSRAIAATAWIWVPYLLAAAVLLVWWLIRPRQRVGRAVAGVIVLEALVLFGLTHAAAPPRSTPHHRDGLASVVRYLQERAEPGDRLFVWGWLPELYSLTRLEPASSFTACPWIVNDHFAVPDEPRIDQALAAMLMKDLEERPPRFIVDASRRSWTLVATLNPWLYGLDLYPDFELVDYLRRGYVRVGRYSNCDVYLRRGEQPRGGGTRGAAPPRPQLGR